MVGCGLLLFCWLLFVPSVGCVFMFNCDVVLSVFLLLKVTYGRSAKPKKMIIDIDHFNFTIVQNSGVFLPFVRGVLLECISKNVLTVG